MRIVSGTLGGRRLRAPAGDATRPTSERVRESIFSILGPPDDETDVLDLFAGSGAMGLEALSRGARHVTFIDSGKHALAALRENLDVLGVSGRAKVIAGDALSILKRPAQRFRWCFIDPPYRSDLATQALSLLDPSLTEDAVVVVEHDRRNDPGDAHGSLIRTDSRRYGDTVIAFYRRREPT
jgi:16S rRNA (guanine966-N2)-methyltransferase